MPPGRWRSGHCVQIGCVQAAGVQVAGVQIAGVQITNACCRCRSPIRPNEGDHGNRTGICYSCPPDHSLLGRLPSARGERSEEWVVPEDLEASEQIVREWRERATERAEKFGQMQEQVEQLSITESSSDGSVQLTIGSNGLLKGLDISESAGNRPMSRLSTEIMRTLQVAQSRLPDLLQQTVDDTVGAEDTAGQHIVGELRKAFPEVEEEDEESSGARSGIQDIDYREAEIEEPPERPATRPAPREEPGDFDDDFGNGSFLR